LIKKLADITVFSRQNLHYIMQVDQTECITHSEYSTIIHYLDP